MAPHPRQLGAWLAAYRPFFAHVRTLAPLQRDLALQHAALADIASLRATQPTLDARRAAQQFATAAPEGPA